MGSLQLVALAATVNVMPSNCSRHLKLYKSVHCTKLLLSRKRAFAATLMHTIMLQVLSALLLGSFPVAFNWVELHGRKPAHTFLDFSAAFFLTAVPCSLALSCTGPKWSFA